MITVSVSSDTQSPPRRATVHVDDRGTKHDSRAVRQWCLRRSDAVDQRAVGEAEVDDQDLRIRSGAVDPDFGVPAGYPGSSMRVTLTSAPKDEPGRHDRMLSPVDRQVRRRTALGGIGLPIRRSAVDTRPHRAADPELARAEVVVFLERHIHRAGKGVVL